MSIRVDAPNDKKPSLLFSRSIRENLPTGEGAPRDRGVGESIFAEVKD